MVNHRAGNAGHVVGYDEGEEGVEEPVPSAQIPAEESAESGEGGLENDDDSSQNGAFQQVLGKQKRAWPVGRRARI